MKYNHTNRISLSCYEYAFGLGLYMECESFNHTLRRRHIEEAPPPPPTHIRRDNTELLPFRTFKHSEFLIKMCTLC